MTDIKMLPLPEGEAIGCTQAWGHDQMRAYARAVAEHNVAARDAEIEALRAELREAWSAVDSKAGWEWKKRAEQAEARAERLAEALRLIAAPIRPDGTWNRDREACRQIARDALRDHDQEVSNG